MHDKGWVVPAGFFGVIVILGFVGAVIVGIQENSKIRMHELELKKFELRPCEPGK